VQLKGKRRYEITSIDLITNVALVERIQLDDKERGTDSNIRLQDDIGAYEEDSLLSVPILDNMLLAKNISSSWADMTDESEDEINTMDEDLDYTNQPVEKDDEGPPVIKGGVKERFKAMIADGLEMNHWDREERMCLSVRKESAKSFANKTVDDIVINEDLKFNLQQAIFASELKFNTKISRKGKVIEDTQISIQKLIYLCERRKKKRDLGSQLSKHEKVDYQDWIMQNFYMDGCDDQIEKAIIQSTCDEYENDLSDEILINSKKIKMPIYKNVKGSDVLLIGLIPGTEELDIPIQELQRVTRGTNFVIVRNIGKDGVVRKGILEVVNCGDTVNEIFSAKVWQINCEAQIETGLGQMDIAKIDVANRTIGPNMLVGLMWKGSWISVQGLDEQLDLDDKAIIIKESLISLQLYTEEEAVKDGLLDKIKIDLEKTGRVHRYMQPYFTMTIIALTKSIDVSWDKGFHQLPNKMYVTTARKVNYIERLPKGIRHLSNKVNNRNEINDIDPIIITILRDDELSVIAEGENIMVVGGFTRNIGSMAMAERTNMSMVMAATGTELGRMLDDKGHLKSIREYGFTFVSLKRRIEGKDRYEVVMLLLARDHDRMKIIRDHILEIKDENKSTWSFVSQHGVKYHYTPTIEEASQLTGIPDTYKVRSLAIYDLKNDTSALEILEKVDKYIVGIHNIQLEEQQNKNDELVLDQHQRPKRAYVLLGNAKVEINDKLISSLSPLMKPGFENEKKIQLLNMLPFWTTTYFFYLTNKIGNTNTEVNSEKLQENKIQETVKPKYNVQTKLNSVRNSEGGRGGSGMRWGDKDELKAMKNRNDILTSETKRKESNGERRGGRGKKTGDSNGSKISTTRSGNDVEMSELNREISNEIEVRESREISIWREKDMNDIRKEMRNMIEENKKDMINMIEDNNTAMEGKMNDNKSEILGQMKEDKIEFKNAFEQMMEIMNGLVKKKLL